MTRTNTTQMTIRRAASAAAVISAAATAAPAASAASYEQITRSSGAYATATTYPGGWPQAAGDVGRFAGFLTYVRDIQANLTTQPGGAATQKIYGFDRLETQVLIGRAYSNRVELALTPLVGGGTSKVVYTVPGATQVSSTIGSAAISGDGSTVVFADNVAKQVRSLNVATGAVKTLLTDTGTYLQGWTVDRFGISWDGRIVAISRGSNPDYPSETRVYRDGTQILSSTSAFSGVSGDGSTLVQRDPSLDSGSYLLQVRKVATGVTKTFTSNVPSFYGSAVWVSPTGDRVVVPDFLKPGQQMNTATGAWSSFGGQFSSAAPGFLAPSGRISVIAVQQEYVLADLSGAELAGASDPVSADVYVHPGATYKCGYFFGIPWTPANYGTVGATLIGRPAAWLPAAQSATITLKVDNTTLKTFTGVLPGTYVSAPFNGQHSTFSQVATIADDQGRATTGTVLNRFAGCG